MKKLENLCWEEEVNEKFQILKQFFDYVMCIILLYWGFELILSLHQHILIISNVPFGVVHLLTCLLLSYTQDKNMLWKTIVPVLVSEYNCLMWRVKSINESHNIELLFALLSFAIVNVCEWPFIRSSLIRVLVLCKDLFIWHYYKYFTGQEILTTNLMPHLLAFLIIFLCELRCRHVKAKTIERFLIRKGFESAEKRLNLIFNLFPEGILILSERKEILYSNENLTKLLRCNIVEVVSIISSIEYCHGRKHSNLSSSNKLIDDINLIPNLVINQEIVLGVSESENLSMEWKGQRVSWENQNAILLTVSNVNHMIELEKTVSDNKLKNILLRSVSHELRTPINAIAFMAESLKEEPEISSNKPWKEKLDMVSVSSKLLLSLVNDLLDYSKILAGAFSIQKSSFLLWNAIYDTVQLIKMQAEKKGLKIFTRIDPQLPALIYTDPLRLSQVLLNLLSNALKFTLKGSIEICCMSNTKQQLRITVKDTGIGISQGKLQDLFKEFNTHHNKSLNPSGCGLGLFISNIIAQELGGSSIEVKSKQQKGSSFTVLIDILEDQSEQLNLVYEEDQDIPLTLSEENSFISIKDFNVLIQNEVTQVLIVDDNDFNRIVLGSLLGSHKILFNEACTGKQAVKLVEEMSIKKKPYKLIIMDGSMPELNGWEAAKMIGEMYNQGVIDYLPTIVGYTAFTSDVELSLCIESGMKECIIKPCKAEILIDKILKYLSK